MVEFKKSSAAADRIPNVTLEGVRIIFRNFSGKEDQYNRAGDRNFAVLLTPEVASEMSSQGWNVKMLKPREEGDDPQAYLPVAVSYKGRPPRVTMITSRGGTKLDEDDLQILDWAEIRNVDLIIRPNVWAVNGNTGVKAYLQSIFVTIEEDELDLKYADIPEAPVPHGRLRALHEDEE